MNRPDLFNDLCPCGCGASLKGRREGTKHATGACRAKMKRERDKKRRKERKERRAQELADAASEYNREHPKFLEVLTKIALEIKGRNISKISFRLVWEKTRAELGVGTTNNYQKWFRLKLEENPGLQGAFRSKT